MSNKKKFKYLIGGLIIFTIVAWLLAFGKTWKVYLHVHQMENRLAEVGGAWQKIENYQKQLDQLEEQHNHHFTEVYLFDEITIFCQQHQLAIQEMPESKIYEEQGMQILQNPIKVEGAYIPMVELLYELEQKQQLGRVVSVKFQFGKNIQNRKEELTAKIHLQNIQRQQ